MTTLPHTLQDSVTNLDKVPYRRIAVEEAWAPPELFKVYQRILDNNEFDDPGFRTMFGFYLNSAARRPQEIRDYIEDLGAQRLAHMDARGIDQQVMALTSPGVQVMGKDEAVGFSIYANDILAEGCAKHPDRFAGLAIVAPQDPVAAAKEIERGMGQLGLKGVMINSHTEAMDAPIYLHPQVPYKTLSGPFLDMGLDGAIFGFAVETGLHMLRILVSGALDHFPKLQFVLGHGAEGLPFWMYRLDYMHRAGVNSKRYAAMQPTERKISEYLRENCYATSSGMAWDPAIRFCMEVMGEDRVMYAMDYPYQHGAEEVAASDAIRISDAAKKKFFQTTAERVFKLKA
jgi:5-carboxyvanillate decarboxylase